MNLYLAWTSPLTELGEVISYACLLLLLLGRFKTLKEYNIIYKFLGHAQSLYIVREMGGQVKQDQIIIIVILVKSKLSQLSQWLDCLVIVVIRLLCISFQVTNNHY